ncbi:MAG TPA: peptidoglycan DD-metalloendopeptidase family protein, partial [Burkholderiales bacterium]|nr:peptidoglycan DD-metalloendopeptidase family protein [Burkholderiales bacterium]
AAAAAPAPSVGPGQYVVKRGDTLYSIALENGADYRDVARWNGLDDPTKIAPGQVLRVAPPEAAQGVQVGAARGPGALQSRPLDAAAVASQGQGDGATKVAPKALRLPYSEENVAMLSKGEAAALAAPVVARPGAATPAAPAKPEPPKAAPVEREPGALDFIWPAKGGLLAKFSEPSSKGVDIAGKAGDPVVAAAAGQVLYTGTGIRGFGKLIVIRHDNGFSSVYAHNREILVKEGQSVTRGQKIAELGDSDADRPKLHFEIRKSGKPVDPMRYLPGAPPS